MIEEIIAYEEYLLSFGVRKFPHMPKFDLMAYTDNEYLLAMQDVIKDFEFIDDEILTIRHLKGD